jgi:hypothetical protein
VVPDCDGQVRFWPVDDVWLYSFQWLASTVAADCDGEASRAAMRLSRY